MNKNFFAFFSSFTARPDFRDSPLDFFLWKLFDFS